MDFLPLRALNARGSSVGSGVICVSGQPCPEDNVDGDVAVIDANTGAIDSWHGYATSDTVGGPRTRHSGFWGLSTTGDGTFSVAGDVRYFQTASADRAGKQIIATLRVAPLSDVLFQNGFEPNRQPTPPRAEVGARRFVTPHRSDRTEI